VGSTKHQSLPEEEFAMDSLKAIATRQNLLGLIQSEQNPATIRSQNTEIWGTPTRTVENQQLMFDDT
jgi:hypothetical protein